MNGWPLPPPHSLSAGEGPLITAPDNINFAPNTTLPPHFIHWRIPIQENYVVSPPGHPYSLQLKSSVLNLTGYDGNYAGPQGQTFISRRQVDTLFTYSVNLDFTPEAEEDEAGVSVFLVQVRIPRPTFSTGALTSRTESPHRPWCRDATPHQQQHEFNLPHSAIPLPRYFVSSGPRAGHRACPNRVAGTGIENGDQGFQSHTLRFLCWTSSAYLADDDHWVRTGCRC